MKRYFWALFFLLVIFGWRFLSSNKLNLPQGGKIRMSGFLQNEPIIIGNSQIFYLSSIKIKTWRLPEFHYGDHLVVVGKLQERVINKFYHEYYLVYPEIESWESFEEISQRGFGWKKILKKIQQFRVDVLRAYKRNLNEPYSSLLAGIVLGVKSQLPADFFETLRVSGTLHVVVASGMNLTFLTPILIRFFSGIFNRFLMIFASFLLVLFYCFLVGFSPPVVRAALMISFAYLASLLGRREEGVLAFLLAGLIMLVYDPKLIFDLSFQLSFAAMGGIIFMVPLLTKVGKEAEGGWSGAIAGIFTQDWRTTFSAQLGVLPIIVVNFGEVSVISLLVNVLVLWTIPYLMGIGILMAFLEMIFPPLARLAALAVWPFLFWFVKVVEFFGSLPLASLHTPKISYWGVLGYYLILGWVVWRKWRPNF